MGGGKPGLRLHGRPLIDFPLRALRQAGLEAIVVAKRDSVLPAVDALVVFDESEILHPLAGIVAALDHAAGRPVVVVGADMPALTPQLLRALARSMPERDAVAASAGDAVQPLCARYGPGTRPALVAALAAQAPLRATLAALRPGLVLTEASVVANVNTLEELAAQRRRGEGAHPLGEADLGREAEGLADPGD